MDIDAAYATFYAAAYSVLRPYTGSDRALEDAHTEALLMLERFIQFKKEDEQRYIKKLGE